MRSSPLHARSFVFVACASLIACSSGGGGGLGGADASSSSSSGSDGGPQASGNGGAPSTAEVNGCTSFVDQTAATAARKIDWAPSVATSPNRCMKVRVGQTVAFEGTSSYPLAASGGASPSPFSSVPDTGKVKPDAAGVFGFACPTTPSMNGALQVVE